MSPDVTVFASTAASTVCSAAGIAFVAARTYAYWRTDRPGPAAPLPDEDRFRHLESAVDAVALQVERIGEGQRFLARVHAECADGVGHVRAAGGER